MRTDNPRSGLPFPETHYSAEELDAFQKVDYLLRHGYSFLGCVWNGHEYEIRLYSVKLVAVFVGMCLSIRCSRQELPPFKTARPYWRSVDVNGNLF